MAVGCKLRNALPVPQIAVQNKGPVVGTPVTFDGSHSRDPDGKIVSFVWNFGDGHVAVGPLVTHPYAQPGRYTVTLTVRDDRNAEASTSIALEVLRPNRAPTAAFVYQPAQPKVNEPVQSIALFTVAPENPQPGALAIFDALGSFDPDGTIILYRWDFGDGMTAEGPIATHAYEALGDYTV